MDDVIFSIIVPIYNGEKYIDRVVNSILPQLNKNLSLLWWMMGQQAAAAVSAIPMQKRMITSEQSIKLMMADYLLEMLESKQQKENIPII